MAVKTTYIEFYYRGAIFAETSVKEVASRDTKGVDVPEGSYGFRYFDMMSTEEGGVKMTSGRLNISPIHYYGGRIMTLDEVRREMSDAHILISNIENNGYTRVIRCRTGNFVPFEDGDIYIED